MDIELLSKMVGELIPDHDEVGLPGLGSLVAGIVPASFSDRGYTINPPYRYLTFIADSSDDDSLVRLYADSNSLDYQQSKSILTHFLAQMRRSLESSRTLTLPGLGKLKATRDNRIIFVMDENLDIYPEGFGLCPISLKAHGDNARQDSEEVQASDAVELFPDPDSVAVSTAGEKPVAADEPVSVAEQVPAGGLEANAESGPVAETETVVGLESPVRKRRALRIILTVAAILVLVAAGFRLLAYLAPDFVDSILYTPEELRIINY